MGFMSYFLIKLFFGRESAQSRSFLALLLNRIGDFLLFCFLLFERTFFAFFAVLTKSSITIFCSWLPNAIERPTPVSSLLHSSTIVVAGVFILSFLGVFWGFFGFLLRAYRMYIGFLGGFFSDYKRIVAYSTSSQLCLIGMFFVVRSFLWSIFYVYIHAFFKAALFLLVGIVIHMVESQELKFFSNTLFWRFFVFCLFCMCGIPFLGVSSSKDDFLLGGGRMLTLNSVFFGVSTIFYCTILSHFFGWGFLGLFFGGRLFFGLFWVIFLSFFNLNNIFCEFFGDFLC